MTPDVSNEVKTTLGELEKLTFQERVGRFKKLDKKEKTLVVEVVDKLFLAKADSSFYIDKNLWGEISKKLLESAVPINEDEQPSLTSKKIEGIFARFTAMCSSLGRGLGEWFESKLAIVGDRLGMVTTATLERKVSDALYRDWWIENYEKLSASYREKVEELARRYLDGDEDLSELIEELDDLQKNIVNAEDTLGKELPDKLEVFMRKRKQAVFEEVKKSIESGNDFSESIHAVQRAYIQGTILESIGEKIALSGENAVREAIKQDLIEIPTLIQEKLGLEGGALSSEEIAEAAEETLEFVNTQREKDAERMPFYSVSDSLTRTTQVVAQQGKSDRQLVSYPDLYEHLGEKTVREGRQEDGGYRIELDRADNATRELIDFIGSQTPFASLSSLIFPSGNLPEKFPQEQMKLHQENAIARLHLDRNGDGTLNQATAILQLNIRPRNLQEENLYGRAAIELKATFVPHTPDAENLYHFTPTDLEWKVTWVDNEGTHESVDASQT